MLARLVQVPRPTAPHAQAVQHAKMECVCVRMEESFTGINVFRTMEAVSWSCSWLFHPEVRPMSVIWVNLEI